MSSEEVAQVARAINSHADALYESWKRSPTMGSSNRGSTIVNSAEGSLYTTTRRMDDTLELLADPGLTPKLEHLVSTFVQKDKAKRLQHGNNSANSIKTNFGVKSAPSTMVQIRPEIVVSQSSGDQNASKKLPRSIEAAVKRFEASKPLLQDVVDGQDNNQASNSLIKVAVPGIGTVSKNVIKAESTSRNSYSHRSSERSSPSPTRILAPKLINSMPQIKSIGAKIRHIPIQREDEPQKSRFSPSKLDSKIFERLDPSLRKQEVDEVSSLYKRTYDNKGIFHSFVDSDDHRMLIADGNYQTPPSGSNSSRIAFAKERIRQSQETPLSQQRLELQKRLPCPSTNLAAAIAMQQGRARFQTVNGFNGSNNSLNAYYDEDSGSSGRPSPLKDNGAGGTSSLLYNGKHLIKFTPGSSVADRVQQFEKYPTHIQPRRTVSLTSLNNLITYRSHDYDGLPTTRHRSMDLLVDTGGQKLTSRSEAHDIPILSRDNCDCNTVPWRKEAAKKPSVASSKKWPIKQDSKSVKLTEQKVPRFFWPKGKPSPTFDPSQAIKNTELQLSKYNYIRYEEFGEFLRSIGIPVYWKKPLWLTLGLKPDDRLTGKQFLPFYSYVVTEYSDDASRFAYFLSSASRYFANGLNNNHKSWPLYINANKNRQNNLDLSMIDFIPLVQDVVDTHPGLGFLREAPEFHSRYITTVISRIFYKVNRSWSGQISLSELRRSNLLQIIKKLEEETDINNITEFFSYEHFYVIYCKFWEIDKDHDLLIDRHDLASHGDHALSRRIIDRIFSGTVIRGWDVTATTKCPPEKMTYSDFVWFLISEEDKKSLTAIEYWFRCLDIDGDGILSPYELQYFYAEQEQRIELLGIEPLDFSNIFCQMIDMLHCSATGIRLRDLKRNPNLAAIIFNTLFNLEKYLDHEQRDPFAAISTPSNADNSSAESDWDKYATSEYELLVTEESPSEHNSTLEIEETS